MRKPQHIGSYDRRISIQLNSAAQDTDGFPINSWQNVYTSVPAKRVWKEGGESEDEGTLHSRQNAVYTFRYVSGITANHRIVEEGINYEILSIQELGRRDALQAQVRAISGV